MTTTTTRMAQDPYAPLKEQQKKGWALFAPLATMTVPEAAHIVDFARIKAGQKVLDVGTGTGVVAITAAQRGATVTGLDLSPDLLTHARENTQLAGVGPIEWKEGDAEHLPFPDASFDVVVSEFGHMFAPRHQLTSDEMLRVLKPGGTIAFSTWDPHTFVGLTFRLVGRYLPPPQGLQVDDPMAWGEPAYIRTRLGPRVRDVVFDSGTMRVPALSTGHYVAMIEKSLGPLAMVVKSLQDRPAELEAFRREYRACVELYRTGNVVRQDYLMTRAVKG